MFAITHTLQGNLSGQQPSLRDLLEQGSRLAIYAKAGAGKSAVAADLALRITESGQHLVVFIDLKKWRHGAAGDVNDTPITVDEMLESSIVPVTGAVIRELHAALGPESREIWFVDGVNELSSELSGRILSLIMQHLRGVMRSSLIVTDRSPSRYPGDDWILVFLQPLDLSEVERHVSGSAGGSNEGEHRRELLRTPFFLEIALTDNRWDWRSSVEAVHSLFVSRVGLDDREIVSLSEFALSTYGRHAGLRFSLAELTSSAGSRTVKKLLESGVLTWVEGSDVTFYHQLLPDYLASRAVCGRSDSWNPRTFDALSFDANTYEAVFMVLGQLDSEIAVTQYLTALYDWNWFGTVRCVDRALRDGLSIPQELVVTLSAMLAEKRFDPVYGSRSRAHEWTERLDSVTGSKFSFTDTIADVVNEVERVRSSNGSEWFDIWWMLFRNIGDRGHGSSESEISLLSDVNPLIGWTASQMIRWCHIDAAGIRQVRALYGGARRAPDDISRSVRWRAVHALGRHPSAENLELLLSAIDHDDYSWVVYGAVRSLLEMAAIAGAEIADQVLAEIGSRLPMLPAQPLSQVAWVTRYEGAADGWKAKVWPLLVRAYEIQTEDVERERWRRRLEAFRLWAGREVTNE